MLPLRRVDARDTVRIFESRNLHAESARHSSGKHAQTENQTALEDHALTNYAAKNPTACAQLRCQQNYE